MDFREEVASGLGLKDVGITVGGRGSQGSGPELTVSLGQLQGQPHSGPST